MARVPTGTLARPSLERPLQGPTLSFRLADEVAVLRAEAGYRSHGRAARTLAKYAEARVVLEAMRAGTRFAPNGPSERLMLQCLEGRVRIHLPDFHRVEVEAGGLCTLDRYMAIEVEALADAACLLTVAWPPAA